MTVIESQHEIEVDSRGRASLKGVGVEPGRYRVTKLGSGIKLEPVRSFTESELIALSSEYLQTLHLQAEQEPERFSPADDLP